MNLLIIVTKQTSCEECLVGQGFKTQFWCVTNQQCMPLSDKDKCSNRELHDLILNATKCCSPITTENQCLAMDSVSFCLWCPTHDNPDTKTEVQGQCMYSGDYININNNCKTNPDITSKCSVYSDCATCSEDVVCAWCPSMGRCVTAILDDMEYPNDQYKCMGGRTKVCCDSYRDCATCSYNAGQITTPICTWCQTTPQGDGKCLTHEKAIADVTCTAINELGKGYCNDKCYLNGKDCKSCISQSGCIWLDEIKYTSDVQEDLQPKIKRFCAVGGSKGPKNSEISYDAQGMVMPYPFTVINYNYMTCGMHAKALNTMIISIICSVAAVILITYVTIFAYKRVKYNKLLREAAKRQITDDDKKLLQQKQEEFDIEDFMITIQAIPWSD
ncbi:Cysteine-rich_membrane protein 2 [Hexamita inflata]|uniref:Cysteine-rich membrane protein 2 n=1 Tax=Hexamita inflata TaxID=28002 RepID=A0AA86N5J7_9EUKA|nr:Cysteine-rich membrane protein 2 [Hexamita inflata]